MTARERPILFSGPMVRAILDGQKTQTRRVVKVPWYATLDGSPTELREADGSRMGDGLMVQRRDGVGFYLAGSPYGWVGDRLWVRETWQYADWTEGGFPFVGFEADGSRVRCERIPDGWGERLLGEWAELSRPENYNIDQRAADRRWRPSIHMPRWASRITLEITDVRVERVQDISEDDARAEGIDPVYCGDGNGCTCAHDFVGEYATLWDSLNAKRGYGWDVNPWVWVIEFSRLPATDGEG